MESAGLSGLGQYGAIGIVLAACLGLMLWMTRRLFERQLTHLDASTEFQKEQTKVLLIVQHELRELRKTVEDQHADMLERLEMRKTPVHGTRLPLPRTKGG